MKIAFQKRDTGVFAWLIKLWTWSKYSHCEVVFSDGTAFSSHIANGGTRFISFLSPSPRVWDFIEIPASRQEEDEIRAWCEFELNCKYDWFGIFFSQVLPLRREHPDRWFCSELCATVVQKLLRLPTRPPACAYSPGGLYRELREVIP